MNLIDSQAPRGDTFCRFCTKYDFLRIWACCKIHPWKNHISQALLGMVDVVFCVRIKLRWKTLKRKLSIISSPSALFLEKSSSGRWKIEIRSVSLSDRRLAACSRWFCGRSSWKPECGENRPRDGYFCLQRAGCAISAGKGEVCAPEIGAVCGSGKVRNMIKAKNASRYYNALSSLIWNCKTARGGLKNRLHRAVYIVF